MEFFFGCFISFFFVDESEALVSGWKCPMAEVDAVAEEEVAAAVVAVVMVAAVIDMADGDYYSHFSRITNIWLYFP